MNTKRGFILPIFILILAITATSAGAYVLKSWHWPSARATFDTSKLPSAWRSVARNAADEWEETDAFNWTHSKSSQNKLSLKSIDGRNSTIATTTHEKHGSFLYKIAIFFDLAESWHTSSGTPPSSKYDALSVATHEFGHAVGLDHPQSSKCSSSVSKSRRPTMCQHGSAKDAKKNDTYRRSLEADDEDGIEDQYSQYASSSRVGVAVGVNKTVCVEFDSVALDPEDRARQAEAVLHGIVESVGPTLWNADDGRHWDDPSSSAAPLPYHIVTIKTMDILNDDAKAFNGSTSVAVFVPRMSPIDTVACGGVGPFNVGDEIVTFVEKRHIAWRTGGLRSFLQTTGDPSSASLIKMPNGDFKELQPFEDAETTYSLKQIERDVDALRQPE